MYAVMWSEHCSYKSSKVHLALLRRDHHAGDAGAHARGHRGERGRRHDRRRVGRHVQDRVAQPPVLRRALPGRGHRGRRHRARHHGDGGAAGRRRRSAALRPGRRARHAARAARRGRGHQRLRQLAGPAQHRRRGGLRRLLRGQPAGQRPVRGRAARGRPAPGVRVRRGQQDHPVRRAHRARRHRRRLRAGQRDLRRRRDRQQAARKKLPVRAGRRPVHGEGAHRVLPRADRGGPGRRHPGPRRGGAVLRHLRAGQRGRRRHARRPLRRSAAGHRHDARGGPLQRVAGADVRGRAARRRRGVPGDLQAVGRARHRDRRGHRRRPAGDHLG